MSTLDLSSLFRSSVGFDRMAQLLNAASDLSEAPAYPPYSIEKLSDDEYVVTMAVAGFSESDLEITVENQKLNVVGRMSRSDERPRSYLHKGIATRAFERSFQLADHVKVVGAKLENGLLEIDLKREVPEALKPRRIPVKQVGRSEEEASVISRDTSRPQLIEKNAA